jgi:chitinase
MSADSAVKSASSDRTSNERSGMNTRQRLWAAASAATLVPATVIGFFAAPAAAASAFPAHYAAPYLQLGSESTGDMAADMSASGLKYYTLAFLIPRSGCTPEWEDGGDSLGAFTAQVNAIKSAGGNVIISFGGEAGGELAETCTSVSSLTAAYQNVVNTYGITRLDFDIEGDPLDNTSANSRRDQALAALQAANPSVQVDFTIPVDPDGLESNALALLNDAKSKGVKVTTVNIMTMDFGDGENALNDAESAANATHTQLTSIYGGSSAAVWGKIGLTPIAGHNDDNENFTQANASTLETFAASKGVGELAFWEVHGYDKPLGYAYSKIFNKITGGSTGGGTGHAYKGGGSGKCIDDNNGSTTNGTQLEIFTCNGGANQSITATAGTLQVLGKCFDAANSATANNTPVQINTCNGGANQQWTINTTNNTIVGVQSGKCLTVQGASTANLAKLLLFTCNGKTNQIWTQQ